MSTEGLGKTWAFKNVEATPPTAAKKSQKLREWNCRKKEAEICQRGGHCFLKFPPAYVARALDVSNCVIRITDRAI